MKDEDDGRGPGGALETDAFVEGGLGANVLDPLPLNRRARVLRAIGIRVRFVLCLVCLVTVWSFIGGEWLPIELATHFRPQYALTLLIGSVYLFTQRSWRWLIPVLLCAGANAVGPLRYFSAPQEHTESPRSESLRLLLANVLTSNIEYGRVIDLVREENPDIVVILETNRRWLNALEPLKDDYPFFVEEARADNFGIAVFARVPMEGLQLIYYGTADVPSVRGRLLLGGKRITVIATHPVPPTGTQMFKWRNEQLRELASAAASEPLCVLIGDLNSTPWSPNYQEFERSSGLRNARLGFGVMPSWPVFLGPLGIPLDHCLVSESISVTNVRLGAATGGDHLPLVVDLQFP